MFPVKSARNENTFSSGIDIQKLRWGLFQLLLCWCMKREDTLRVHHSKQCTDKTHVLIVYNLTNALFNKNGMPHYTHYSSTYCNEIRIFLTMHYCILHLLNVSRLSRNRIYNKNMAYFLKYIVKESIQIEFGNSVETSVWVPCAHSVLIFLQNVCM